MQVAAGLTVEELRARKSEVIKGLGLGRRSFAYDNWDEVLALLAPKSATMTKDKKLSPPRVVPSILSCSNSGVQTVDGVLDAASATATQAQTIDPPWIGPDDGPPEVEVRDNRRHHRACGPVDVPVYAMTDVPEPVAS